jgi:hypothetical protein
MSIASTPKPRILAGLTYATGRTNRLLLTIGAVGGPAQTISSAYSTTTTYYAAPGGFTVNTLKAGAFFSLNFSFIN